MYAPSLAVILMAALCVTPGGRVRADEAASIHLTAKPDAILADGATTTTITAEVRSSGGSLAPDTEFVHFSTTLGTIEPVAQVRGGQASVRLTSSTVAGVATVTASSSHATAEIKVVFSAKPVVVQDTLRAVNVHAKYLVYNDLEKVLDAAEDVYIRIGPVTIRADRAQIDFTRSLVIAQSRLGAGALIMTSGKNRIAVDRLQYNWDAHLGFASGLFDPLRGVYTLTGSNLTLVKSEGATPPETFALRDLEPSPLSIKASRVVYIPGQEIQFTHAQIMLNGKPRISLPYHVMPVNGGSGDQAQYVGLGPRGPLLDIPYYVAAGELGTSQLRLKFNAPEGLYGATVGGWALDLLNKYSFGTSSEGTLELTRLTSPDWGLTWSHNQTFGPSTRAYVNLDTRAGLGITGLTQGVSPRYTLANFQLSHQFQGYNLNVTAFGNHYARTTGDLSLVLQSPSWRLPAGFSWTAGLQETRLWSTSSISDATAPVVQTHAESVNARLATPMLTLPGNFTLGASVGQGISFVNGQGRRSFVGTVNANKPLGRYGAFSLTYNYNDYGLNGDAAIGYYGLDRQTVTANVRYGHGSRWMTAAFATIGLDQHSRNVRFTALYNITPVWNASLNAGIFEQRLNIINNPDFRSTNVEARITRYLGERSLSLVYDTYRNRIYFDYTPGRYF